MCVDFEVRAVSSLELCYAVSEFCASRFGQAVVKDLPNTCNEMRSPQHFELCQATLVVMSAVVAPGCLAQKKLWSWQVRRPRGDGM